MRLKRINALAVHPTDPRILASASSDFSVRLYDLTEPVPDPPDLNLLIEDPGPSEQHPWGAPAFGMRAYEKEGDGRGCCFAVLVGQQSGGHLGGVLGVVSVLFFLLFFYVYEFGFGRSCFNEAFHPTLPMIVTCGVSL